MNRQPDPTTDALSIPVARVRSREEFIACLDRARVLAGPLSHREIETRSARRLRRTKVGQVLAGELPRRDFLVTYLEVCGVPATERPTWLRAWAGLLTAEPGQSTVDIEISGEVTQVLSPFPPASNIAPEIRRLHDDLEEMRQSLRRSQFDNQELRHRLAKTESAYAESSSQTRVLRGQLLRAQDRINELAELVTWLRTNEPVPDEKPVADELAPPVIPPPPNRESKYPPAYTSAEIDDLFGGNPRTAPPVVGL